MTSLADELEGAPIGADSAAWAGGPGPHRRRERRPQGRLRHAKVARGRIGPERRSWI